MPDKKCESHEQFAVDLAVIKSSVINIEGSLKDLLQTQEKKVSWRTFSFVFLLIFSIFSGITSYIFVDTNRIDASVNKYQDQINYVVLEVKKFQQGIQQCDFSEYMEVTEHESKMHR